MCINKFLLTWTWKKKSLKRGDIICHQHFTFLCCFCYERQGNSVHFMTLSATLVAQIVNTQTCQAVWKRDWDCREGLRIHELRDVSRPKINKFHLCLKKAPAWKLWSGCLVVRACRRVLVICLGVGADKSHGCSTECVS